MPTDIKLYQMFGGEKVCELFFVFLVCLFFSWRGGGGRDGLIIFKKKWNFFY